MINENNISLSPITLKKLEDRLKKVNIPIEMFKLLLSCAIKDDFTELNDPVIKTRYKESYEKVFKHIQAVIYQDIYVGSTTYDNFIGMLIKLYAVFDTLINGRLHITDISMQNKDIVEIFLDSYGMDLFPIFDDDVNRDIARNVYYYLRRKGTPYILSIMLNHLGFTHYRIDEYEINKKEDEWVLAPKPIYISDAAKTWDFKVDDFKVSDINDPMWWLDIEDLDMIYNSMIGGE